MIKNTSFNDRPLFLFLTPTVQCSPHVGVAGEMLGQEYFSCRRKKNLTTLAHLFFPCLRQAGAEKTWFRLSNLHAGKAVCPLPWHCVHFIHFVPRGRFELPIPCGNCVLRRTRILPKPFASVASVAVS